MPTPDDFSQKNAKLRDRIVRPCGGWLGEFTIFLSHLTGIWDSFILATIFVIAWVVLRTSGYAPALVGGLLFDVAIPYQYQNSDRFRKKHEKHLEAYWPVCIGGTVLEAVCWLLTEPAISSLVICLKTTLCLAYWLSKRSDGSQVILDFRNEGHSRSRPTTNDNTEITAPNNMEDRPATFPPIKVHPSKPNIDQELKDLGYDDPMTRWWITKQFGKSSSQGRNVMFSNLTEFNTPEDRKRRTDDYNAKAMEYFKAPRGWFEELATKAAKAARNAKPVEGGFIDPQAAHKMTMELHGLLSDAERRDIRSKLIESKNQQEADAIWLSAVAKAKEERKKQHFTYGPHTKALTEDGTLEKAMQVLMDDTNGPGLVPSPVMEKLINRMVNRSSVGEAKADLAAWEKIKALRSGQNVAVQNLIKSVPASWA